MASFARIAGQQRGLLASFARIVPHLWEGTAILAGLGLFRDLITPSGLGDRADTTH